MILLKILVGATSNFGACRNQFLQSDFSNYTRMLGSLESCNYGIRTPLHRNNALTLLNASENIVKEV